MQIIASVLSLLVSSAVLIKPVSAAVGDNPAIVVAIDAFTDNTELCYTFKTLIHAKGFPNAPIFAFTAIDLSQETIDNLYSCTTRPLSFIDVKDLHADFPPSVNVLPGVSYEYAQTQRFMSTRMWDQPALDPYDVIMRVSDATCLTFDDEDLPGFPDSPELDHQFDYKSYTVPNELQPTQHTEGIYELTLSYLSLREIAEPTEGLWPQLSADYHVHNKLSKFSDDFEIVRKSFMQTTAVRDYMEHLTENEVSADLFFQRKWSAGTLRKMAVALFLPFFVVSDQHIPGVVEKDFLAGNLFPSICRNPPIQ